MKNRLHSYITTIRQGFVAINWDCGIFLWNATRPFSITVDLPLVRKKYCILDIVKRHISQKR